jgi:hypothetical protein
MINIRWWRALGELFQLLLIAVADLYDSYGFSLLHEHYVKIAPADTARPQTFRFYVGLPLRMPPIEGAILFAEKVNGLLFHPDMSWRLNIFSVPEGRLRPIGRIGIAVKGNGSWIAFPWLCLH